MAVEAAEHATAELPSLFSVLEQGFGPHPVLRLLTEWQSLWFTLIAILAVAILVRSGTRRQTLVPRGLQNVFEIVMGGFDSFVCSILGPAGRAHTPFIGTLFLYILFMNWMGLIPLIHSPVAASGPSPIGLPIPTTTLPLAVCAILYVNLSALRASGLGGYLHHLCGSPSHFLLWLVAPLVFAIHAIGELGKIFSLSMRLFGNISGEDTLIAVIISQSAKLAQGLHLWPVLPLHFPFLLLGLLTGVVQAFVFALLTTVYLALMLPHEEHAEEAHHEEAPAHAG